jgi:hypothetical protein
LIRNGLFLLLLNLIQLAYSQEIDDSLFNHLTLEMNINQHPDSVIYLGWDENSASWKFKNRYVYYYKDDKTLKEEVSHERLGEWELESKMEYFYNGSLLIDKKHSLWDWYYLEWIEYIKYEFTYDSNSNLKKRINSNWDSNIDDWVNDSLFVSNYNSNNLISETYEYVWIPFISDWEGSLKTTYLYDSILLNIENTEFVWNYDSTDFIPHTKRNFIYNSNLQLSEYLQYKVNANHTGWENYRRSVNTYNTNGLIHEHIYYIWVFYENAYSWVENLKYTFIYDDNEDLIETTSFVYDWDMLTWVNSYQIVNDFYASDLLKSSTCLYWEYNQWNELEQYKYYYPGYSSIDLPADAAINIYPNPAKEKLCISIPSNFSNYTKIEIIDLKGVKVYETSDNSSKTLIEINLPKLPKGLYIVRITSTKEVFSKKMLIAN